MDPEARANPDPRVHLQQRDGEPAQGRDCEDPEASREVWDSRGRQRLLLVPEQAVKVAAEAAANAGGQRPSWRRRPEKQRYSPSEPSISACLRGK